MATRVRTVRDLAEYRAGVTCIGSYFAWHPSEDDARLLANHLPLERMHVAVDGGDVVGGAGAFPLRLSAPGGTVGCAGVTVVGVLPTHRRRGLLARMMDAQLRDVRERGEPIAALWASQESIYGRFGYGIATTAYKLRLAGSLAGLHGVRPAGVSARLVEPDEALRVFPRLYATNVRRTAGLIDRTPGWWVDRTLMDDERRRRGAGPLSRLLLERDGRPAGYALYRITSDTGGGTWTRTLRVGEACGVDDAALLEVWRYLLAVDWMDTIEAHHLSTDHPLVLALTRVREAQLTLTDGLWVRPVDVGAALAARSYASPGRVVIEVTDDQHFPDNVGVWQVDVGSVRRGRGRPDVRVPVAALGSAYLGGFGFAALGRAGLAEQMTRNGFAKADAFFRTPTAPYCAEVF